MPMRPARVSLSVAPSPRSDPTRDSHGASLLRGTEARAVAIAAAGRDVADETMAGLPGGGWKSGMWVSIGYGSLRGNGRQVLVVRPRAAWRRLVLLLCGGRRRG